MPVGLHEYPPSPSPSSRLVDLLYNFLSANRLSLGGALDGIIAAKRMDLSKQGKETCGGEFRLS